VTYTGALSSKAACLLAFIGLTTALGACASVALGPAPASQGASDGGVDLASPADSAVSADLHAPCTQDADCGGATPACDTTTGVCVACTPTDDTCPIGHYCEATNTCVVGCRSAADCATDGGASTCQTSTHECVGCVTDNDCALGSLCQSQTCVPGCSATHGCDIGKTCCGTQCESLATDPAHCGSCTNVCDSTHSNGATCVSSVCEYASCGAGYADCSTASNDVDGCECPTAPTPAQGTAGCCSKSCQTVHMNGYMGSYYDCVALGTYNGTQAIEAATSATSVTGTPSDTWSCTNGTDTAHAVCKQGSSSCSCWTYSSTNTGFAAAGRVHKNPTSNSCFCATSADDPWN